MLQILRVDLHNRKVAQQWLDLLNQYALDPMGGGDPLSDFAKAHVVERLLQRNDFVSFIAFDHETPVGLINAFEGFSTFNAKPLLNIHDVMVLPEWRGRGIAQQLLTAMAAHARTLDCCKLTLEILSNNENAKQAYQQFGFRAYELDPLAGTALFWEYSL